MSTLHENISSVVDFLGQCCVFAPDARTPGAELLMALAGARQVVGMPEGIATWEDIALALEQQGCTRQMSGGGTVWHGVALKSDGLHADRTGRVETVCGHCASGDIFSRGPVHVCKGCKTEWLLSCPRCATTIWVLRHGEWTCENCQYHWVTDIELRTTTIPSQHKQTHADGHTITTDVYRCPGCGGTNWGPTHDDPATWCCLDCVRSSG